MHLEKNSSSSANTRTKASKQSATRTQAPAGVEQVGAVSSQVKSDALRDLCVL